ncbi:MAG: VTT domain-containing protein [Roseiflexus sp.]|uniref:VTT domain-containing protein n=1 Tax=Roseiflexus sp. TaxID=2562120 RepID=UPI0025E20349|nr:VTT domain-containing protein [Roseiflexus sp.]MCL6540249.1 VTT domain-containing protein [Roseiflexus sp.]
MSEAESRVTRNQEIAITPQKRSWIRPMLVAAIAIALNIIAYLIIPPDLAYRLGSLGYIGVFLITLISNATIVVPIPYFGLVAALSPGLSMVGVGIAGALGSVIGESVGFFVGRSGRGVVEQTRFYRWVQRQLEHQWRAFVVLFALSAPPNPAFDVAGLTAGAMGLPYWIFLSAVFLARLVRFGIVAFVGGAT